MYECYKGKVVTIDSRRGVLRRTKVLGLIKCTCMEIKWEDTKKSEMIMMSKLRHATLEDGTPLIACEEDGCADGHSM
jgi:hypothetical protein